MARLSEGKTGERVSRTFYEEFTKQLENLRKDKSSDTKASDTQTSELNTETLRDLVDTALKNTLQRLREKS
jgi:hypothetical protein